VSFNARLQELEEAKTPGRRRFCRYRAPKHTRAEGAGIYDLRLCVVPYNST